MSKTNDNTASFPFTLGQVLKGRQGSSEEGCTFIVTCLDPLIVKPDALNALWTGSRLRDYSHLRNIGIGLRETYIGDEWSFNDNKSAPWFIFYGDGTFCHYR